MIDPTKLKLTKSWVYDNAKDPYNYQVDADALALSTPSGEWKGDPNPRAGVTTTYYETHFFRAYGWTNNQDHEWLRFAVPGHGPGRVRNVMVDGWPETVKKALVDQAFQEVQQSVVAGRA